MLDFAVIAQQCAPEIHANTLAHVVQVESDYNPLAIAVVGAHLPRQPRDLREAVATAAWLEAHHYNFSVGLGQVNRSNFARYGLTVTTAFEPCRNLQAAAAILKDCYLRARQTHPDEQTALRDAFSCYYSGNFTTGYKAGYVVRVITGRAGPVRKRPGDGGVQAGAAAAGPAGGGGDVRTPSALLF
jgi:type IV secretion system protein VirB1